MFLLVLLVSIASNCRGMESDSVQEEMAQLRAQMKILTKTVEDSKKREDELIKKLEGLTLKVNGLTIKEEETAKAVYGLTLKEEETAKKLYGLTIKEEDSKQRVDGLATEVRDNHAKEEEIALKLNILSMKDEEITKKVGSLVTEIKQYQEKDEETARRVGFLAEEVKENHKKIEDAAKKVEGMAEEIQENHRKEEKTLKIVEGLTLKVEENDKKDEKTVQKLESVTLKVEENDKKDEKTVQKVESVTKEVEENHKKEVETAIKVESLSTNINEYCSMLAKDICGPCQCKDDRRLEKQYFCSCQNLPIKRDCLQYHSEGFKTDGIYRIHQNNLKVVQVFCDQTTDEGGWTVFQRRLDGSVKFYRNWANYKRGFGDVHHEFWMGNDNLFTMSVQGLVPAGNELRIELEDWEGGKRYAKYTNFQVANEQRSYQMYISGYSGTAGDSHGFSYHNTMKFTTFDKDNDNNKDKNCAQEHLGGWWYNDCAYANLNGNYYDYPKWGAWGLGLEWYDFQGGTYSLKFTEMKMRRKIKE